jgi:hypothetical protein
MMEAEHICETLVTTTKLHGAISEKAQIFILAAVRTLNLTFFGKYNQAARK